jgi:hypothetical protein
MNIGDKIELNTCIVCPIIRTDSVYTVKYDGVDDVYVVCNPEEGTHIVMACIDTEGDKINVVFMKDFEGNTNIIDLL